MVKPRQRIKTLKVLFTAVAMMLAVSSTSQAGPLGITFNSTPVMNAQTITSLFNATTGMFSASGTAVGWDTGTGNNVIAQPFKLTANFAGGAPTTASLTIGLDAAPYVFAADLVQFAYSAVKGGTIEFLFNTVSGSSGVFSSGAPLDVALTVSSTFTPQFTTSWFNSQETAVIRQSVTTDTPEPSALLLLIAGAGGFLVYRRRLAALMTS